MYLTAAVVASFILYLVAGTGLLARFVGRGPRIVRTHRPVVLSVAWLAVALHTWVLYSLIFTHHGLDLGFFNTASLVGWQVALIVLIALPRQPLENLGIVVLPLAAISLVLARGFPGDKLFVPEADWPLDAHILISLLAYSLLSIGALQAIVLAIQEHRLRHKLAAGLFATLPPLQVMEHLLFQMIAAGFALLSLALFSGFIFVHNLFEQHLVHKTVLSVIAWVVFAILLWGRWRFGWRGRTAIRWTLGGFVVLMLAYFGSKLVLELILGRHWMLMS